jgi:hypothetical protein
MLVPGKYSFTLYRGSTDPFSFRITNDQGALVPYTDLILTISKKNSTVDTDALVRMQLSLADPNFIADAAGVVTWTPTPAQSRSLGVGMKQKYEVEVRNGPLQLIYLIGDITGAGGINSDD